MTASASSRLSSAEKSIIKGVLPSSSYKIITAARAEILYSLAGSDSWTPQRNGGLAFVRRVQENGFAFLLVDLEGTTNKILWTLEVDEEFELVQETQPNFYSFLTWFIIVGIQFASGHESRRMASRIKSRFEDRSRDLEAEDQKRKVDQELLDEVLLTLSKDGFRRRTLNKEMDFIRSFLQIAQAEGVERANEVLGVKSSNEQTSTRSLSRSLSRSLKASSSRPSSMHLTTNSPLKRVLSRSQSRSRGSSPCRPSATSRSETQPRRHRTKSSRRCPSPPLPTDSALPQSAASLPSPPPPPTRRIPDPTKTEKVTNDSRRNGIAIVNFVVTDTATTVNGSPRGSRFSGLDVATRRSLIDQAKAKGPPPPPPKDKKRV